MTGISLLALAVFSSSPSWAQTPVAPPPPAAPARVDLNSINLDDYTLGPGDRIGLTMFDQADLFADGYTVLADGTISLPFIGRVLVNGLTLKQAENAIAARYIKYYKRPLITMTLTTPRQMKVAISGEVTRPGTYTIEGGNPTKVSQVIGLAGGITQSADLRGVKIRRQQSTGAEQIVSLDLWKLLQEGDLSQDLNLRDGDAIVIPPATSFNPVESRLIANTSFSAPKTEPVNISVLGEVYRPGPATTSGGIPTVTKAIQVAGGIKPLADIRSIELRRQNNNGSEQVINVDLWALLQEGDAQQDVVLQQGDTLIIPKADALSPADATTLATTTFSPATIKVNVVGEVKRPGVAEVPPNSPLNAAILAAGGFDDRRAKKSSVGLIRLNPDGTVIERKVDVDFSQGINEETNPVLNNNDVIVVGRSGLTTFTDNLGTVLSPVTSGLSIFNIFRFLAP